ncbi:DUF6056 family protein [Companilactobacillus sp. DQM5]|uniref:DUF6056 family protein n=1 Tax=Companilactobacillus sp. DQM5 TaxID=3463359 RepID=UPI004059EE99
MMKKYIKKVNYETVAIVLIIFLLFFLNIILNIYGGHEVIPVGGDDKGFGHMLSEYGIFNFMKYRYDGWSSRVLIELVLSLMVHLSFMWRILDTMAMFTVVYIPYRYLLRTEDDKKNFLYLISSFSLFFMIRVEMFNQAGWVATTTNYLWVLACGELSLIPIIRKYFNQKNNILIYILSILFLIYAVNQEQMAGIMFLILASIVCYKFLNKMDFKFEFFQLLITLGSIIFILLSKGNKVRNSVEMSRMPLLDKVSLLKKIELGFSSTISHFLFNFQVLFFVLTICVFLAILQKKLLKNIWTTSLFALPAIFVVLFGKNEIFNHILPINYFFVNSVHEYGTNLVKNNIVTWIPDIVLLLLSIILIFGICIIGEKSLTSFFIVGLLVVGFLSRIIMGFSPTIWASGPRTFMFMYETIIISIMYIISKMNYDKLKFTMLLMICFIGIFQYMSFINVIV